MPESIPSLTSAFRLGRMLEELASINRKHMAIQTIRSCDPEFQDSCVMSISQKEVELTKQELYPLCRSLMQYLPGKLLEILQKLDESGPTGMGLVDAQQTAILHCAVEGLIQESMARGTIWRCLQIGRLTQRSWLVISNIRDTLKDHKHMPNNCLLSYIVLRTDIPAPDLDNGTHLWNVHRVFQEVLKQEKNPKSLIQTLSRMSPHISELPLPELLKKDHENVVMTLNRITNDLSFIDIHDMIGDDPEDHFSQIMDFFDRHQHESEKLTFLIRHYLESFEAYIDELSEDEVFSFEL